MFFKKLKEKIQNAAKIAVLEAEISYGKGNGAAKKQMAINFVLNALCLPPLVERLIGIFLSAFIDVAVETAVTALKLPVKTTENDTP